MIKRISCSDMSEIIYPICLPRFSTGNFSAILGIPFTKCSGFFLEILNGITSCEKKLCGNVGKNPDEILRDTSQTSKLGDLIDKWEEFQKQS